MRFDIAMSDTRPTAVTSEAGQPMKPIVYKAFEFAKPSSGGDFVLVREYRTFYYLDGRVQHEVVLMETPFEQLVNAFHGVVRKSAGLLTGLFDAPEHASACARKVDDLYNKTVEIRGSQITMAI